MKVNVYKPEQGNIALEVDLLTAVNTDQTGKCQQSVQMLLFLITPKGVLKHLSNNSQLTHLCQHHLR